MNCTVVLSYQEDSSERLLNLKLNKNILLNLKIPFILSEQITSKNTKEVQYDLNSDFLHIKYFSSELFEKSKLYNLAVKKVETEYIWFLDCDVFTNPTEVIKYLNGDAVYRPFGKVFELDKFQSQLFRDGLDSHIDYSLNPYCQTFGKHSFIIHKSLFDNGLEFDELFKGWGWEDLDFVRSKLKGFKPNVLSQLKGFHLFHPDSNNINSRSNYNLYLENLNPNKKICYCFCIYDFSIKTVESINKMLDEHRHLHNRISFVFYFCNNDIDYNRFINLLNLTRFDHLSFLNKNSKFSIQENFNNCIYLCCDSIFCLLSDDFYVPLQTSLTALKKINENYFNVNNFHFFSRKIFNSFSGLHSKYLKSINLELKSFAKNIKSGPDTTIVSDHRYWNIDEVFYITHSGRLEKFCN